MAKSSVVENRIRKEFVAPAKENLKYLLKFRLDREAKNTVKEIRRKILKIAPKKQSPKDCYADLQKIFLEIVRLSEQRSILPEKVMEEDFQRIVTLSDLINDNLTKKDFQLRLTLKKKDLKELPQLDLHFFRIQDSIKAGERQNVQFLLANKGKGTAFGIDLSPLVNMFSNIDFAGVDPAEKINLEPLQSKLVSFDFVPVSAGNIYTNSLMVNYKDAEGNDFTGSPNEMTIRVVGDAKAEKARFESSNRDTIQGAAELLKNGNELLNLGDADKALINYEKSIRMNPYAADAYAMAGMALIQLGRPAEAMASISKGVELAPNVQIHRYRRSLARFHLAVQNPEHVDTDGLNQSLEEVNELLRYGDTEPYLSLRGRIYAKMGNYSESIKSHNRALNTGENLSNAHYSKAQSFLDFKLTDEALQRLDTAIQIEPGNSSYYALKAELLNQLKLYDKGLEAITKACELKPSALDYRITRASLLDGKGSNEEALREIDGVLSADQSNLRAKDLKYAILERTGGNAGSQGSGPAASRNHEEHGAGPGNQEQEGDHAEVNYSKIKNILDNCNFQFKTGVQTGDFSSFRVWILALNDNSKNFLIDGTGTYSIFQNFVTDVTSRIDSNFEINEDLTKRWNAIYELLNNMFTR